MMDRRLVEQIETLAGTRRHDARGKAAVRLEDLGAVLQMPPRLKSARAAGAAPTKAEFDALVDDVHAIHRRLLALAEAIQARVLP